MSVFTGMLTMRRSSQDSWKPELRRRVLQKRDPSLEDPYMGR